MQKVICEHCKETSLVSLYFYDARVLTHTQLDNNKWYEASVKGRTICPRCGREIVILFEKPISVSDIIDLARDQSTD